MAGPRWRGLPAMRRFALRMGHGVRTLRVCGRGETGPSAPGWAVTRHQRVDTAATRAKVILRYPSGANNGCIVPYSATLAKLASRSLACPLSDGSMRAYWPGPGMPARAPSWHQLTRPNLPQAWRLGGSEVVAPSSLELRYTALGPLPMRTATQVWVAVRYRGNPSPHRHAQGRCSSRPVLSLGEEHLLLAEP